jgi:hypothetical protein
MSHVTRLPVSTRVSDVTGPSSLRNLSRPRTSVFRFRSTPEPCYGDHLELQQLLPSTSRYMSEDPHIPTETDDALGPEHPNISLDNLLGIVSGTRDSDAGDLERTDSAQPKPRPRRKVVDALNTLIRYIDQQDHRPPRWTHVRPWLLSATRHTPRADTTNTSFTQLEVPPAVRRYLAASRHESWGDETRKAARTARTWVGYDVIAKSVMEVDAAEKDEASNDVWQSWWAI